MVVWLEQLRAGHAKNSGFTQLQARLQMFVIQVALAFLLKLLEGQPAHTHLTTL